jgi:hypothetical protein
MTALISRVAPWGVKAGGEGRPGIAAGTPNRTPGWPGMGSVRGILRPGPSAGAASLDTRAGGFYIASFALRP